VENLLQVIPSWLGHEVLGQTGRLPFMLPAPGCGRSSAAGNAAGDPMEPTGQGGSASYRSGLACQDQESRLKGILGVMLVTEDRAADTQHHRTVSLDQGLERHFAGPTLRHHEPLE
jgi:hypothetical protein